MLGLKSAFNNSAIYSRWNVNIVAENAIMIQETTVDIAIIEDYTIKSSE